MTDVLEGAHIAGCRIEAVAGRGGMGIVYRATQISLGRPVALKLIAPEHAADRDFRERFQRESRMAAAIDHPNVIPVYEAGEEDGRLYLVMRWVAGTDLHRLLRDKGRLEPARAAAIVNQVAGALDAAHAAGLVHRDVKPANVLLSNDHAYLADFGLTRVAGADTRHTTAGHFLGTVDYMAPEQFQRDGSPIIDARADVYALGCVLFSALTGEPPFRRDTVPATMLAHMHDPPPRASDAPGVPSAFDRVLARALAKAPEDRFPSAGDFGRVALAAAEGRSITTEERSVARGAAAPTVRREDTTLPRPEPPPIRTYRTRPRRLWALAVGAAVLAAAALAVTFLPGGDGAPPPGGNVSEAEVSRLAKSFAAAYANESSARLSRLLTSDVQRVSPDNRQSGRRDVVEVYRNQFASSRTTDFELADLEAQGGPVARATARYRVSYDDEPDAVGTMTWAAIRERGRPRISLIVVRPD
ncbi:MAG TPA: serine/threonine-protein kinase [Solirubrobacter sp.]|nr:serine/threonine-protein kinase [Solirubrobacter sp.]